MILFRRMADLLSIMCFSIMRFSIMRFQNGFQMSDRLARRQTADRSAKETDRQIKRENDAAQPENNDVCRKCRRGAYKRQPAALFPHS